MKFKILVAPLLFAVVVLLPVPLAARATPAGQADKPAAQALCLPGIYLTDPGDCLPAGPSAYLTQLGEQGLTFPPAPLPAVAPDPALSQLDMQFGMVPEGPAPVFATAEEALQNNKKNAVRFLDPGFTYISYREDREEGGKRVYAISSGGWMTANDVKRTGPKRYQGLEFTRTPSNAFGWVLPFSSSLLPKQTPGFKSADVPERALKPYDVVQVYGVRQADGEDWYQVGPDQWIYHKYIARVIPDTTPPTGVTGDRWIAVNLYEQTLAVYDRRELVFAAVIASGVENMWTRPGLFQIKQKLESTVMRGSDVESGYYLEDVPWTMYFDGARALHGAYWRANLGYAQSHGCVNLWVGDAHWLFNWANEGDYVYVWDPSGQTPTDPAQYSSGGY